MTGNPACNDDDRGTEREKETWSEDGEGQGDEMMTETETDITGRKKLDRRGMIRDKNE